MARPGTCGLVGLLAWMLGGALLSGCGTSPTDVDGCRAIEEARCHAAPGCPGFENLDVDSCVRRYQELCLHGMTIESPPGRPAVDRCVSAIEAAGHCAAKGKTECEEGPFSTHDDVVQSCTVIAHPEQVRECAFLRPAEPPPEELDAGSDVTEGDSDAASDEASDGGSSD